MKTGDTVYLAFETSRGSDGRPVAWVNEATVLDAENRVVRRQTGHVAVMQPWSCETVHATEAEAWNACASRLAVSAAAVEAEASRCAAKAAEAAAASQIVQVPA